MTLEGEKASPSTPSFTGRSSFLLSNNLVQQVSIDGTNRAAEGPRENAHQVPSHQLRVTIVQVEHRLDSA